MEKVESLKKDYNSFAKKCFARGINPSDIFTKSTGVNKELLTAILNLFNKNIKGTTTKENEEVILNLVEYYQGLQIGKGQETQKVVELDCGSNDTLVVSNENYKNNFVDVMKALKVFADGGYLISDGSKLDFMNVSAELDDLNAVNKLVGKSKEKLYEGVITTDGKFYVSLSEHEGLCLYLNACGVDLKGALRITQMPGGQGTFSLSSLHHFSYLINSVKDDKNIILEDAQAKSLYKFFKAIKSENKGGGQTLLSIFMRSVGLGWDFMSFYLEDINISLKHARRNLETLELNSDGEFDGSGMYKKIVEYSRELGLMQTK